MTAPDVDLPVLADSRAVLAEIRWVAQEARALVGSTDQDRRAGYFARKDALMAYLEGQD